MSCALHIVGTLVREVTHRAGVKSRRPYYGWWRRALSQAIPGAFRSVPAHAVARTAMWVNRGPTQALAG